MHLFLFTNSAQLELVSVCTQSMYDRNKLSLPYILGRMYLGAVRGDFSKYTVLSKIIWKMKTTSYKYTVLPPKNIVGIDDFS